MRYSPKDMVLALPALLVAVCVRILRPIVTIRFRNFPADDLGAMIVVSQNYLRIKEPLNRSRRFDFWYLKPEVKISSEYLLGLISSQIKIHKSRFIELVAAWSEKLPGSSSHLIESEIRITPLEGVSGKFGLSQSDRDLSGEYLGQIGIDPQKQFVTLMVRDAAFKSDVLKPNSHLRNDKENYRNHDINDYLLVAEKFAAMGVQVIRTGAKVERRFESQSPLIIDYASSGKRTEAADIYLASECAMCISTTSGLDHVAAMSGRPRVITNQGPIDQASRLLYSSDVFILQRFAETTSGKNLTLSESLQFAEIRNLDWYHKVIDRGLQFVRNTPTEIFEASLEGWQRQNSQWVDTAEDLELQAQFWHIYDRFFPDHKSRFLKGRPHIGSHFLRTNKWWLA